MTQTRKRLFSNAERYKTLWVEQKKAAATPTGTGLNYGTAAQFTQDLKNAFKETNKKHNALHELRHIKQGSDTIDDFNNMFKLLVSQTKITDDLTLVDAYRDVIKPQIAHQILMMENIPTTINDWYEKAATFDNNYRRLTKQIRKFKPKSSSHNFKFKTAEKDPNAMDIDALCPQEQKGLKEQGRCFFCKEKGHYARNCPKRTTMYGGPGGKGRGPGMRGQAGKPGGSWRNKGKRKMTPFKNGAHIRAILEGCSNEEEVAELIQNMEDWGLLVQ